ncbi:isoprenoid synthase domain-containing protein [Aspergillus californicus]
MASFESNSSTLSASSPGNEWGSISQLFEPNQSFVVPIILAISSLLFAFFKHLGSDDSKKEESLSKLPVTDDHLTKADYEAIINNFLGEISFKAPNYDFSKIVPELELRITNRMKAQGVSCDIIDQVRQKQCVNTAATMTSYTYSSASVNVQEAIATFAAYAISIDDLTTDFAEDLHRYATNLTLGQPQRHSLLQGLTNHLSEQYETFGPFGGDMIIKGALEFISSAKVEVELMDTIHLSKDTTDFLEPFRAKTGVAEPFAFFCFPEDTHPEKQCLERYIAAVPTVMLFLDYVNDLLSFYKEHVKSGDSASFVTSYARLHGHDLGQALRHVKVEAVNVIRRLRSIGAEDVETFGNMERFIQGYIWFHLRFRRYKLDELNIPLATR